MLVFDLELALFRILGFGLELALFPVLRLDLDVFLGDALASGSFLTMAGTINGSDSSSTKTFLGLISGLKVDLILDSSIPD